MLSEITHNIYCLPISTVFLIMLLITPVFGVGIAWIKRRWPKKTWIVCFVLSALYVLLILCLTVLGRNAEVREMPELIPFSVFIRAQEQPELYREVIMNIFLFWPIGLFLPQGIEKITGDSAKNMSPVLITILIACILSITIETIQYIFSLGLVEIDDVTANTLGAAIGGISFLISGWLNKHNNNSQKP